MSSFTSPTKVSTSWGRVSKKSTDYTKPSRSATGYIERQKVKGTEENRLLYRSHTLYPAHVLYNGVSYQGQEPVWSKPSKPDTDWSK